MKIEKAIEILELNLTEAGASMPPDCKEAVQLGVEALNYVERNRNVAVQNPEALLPGETEE